MKNTLRLKVEAFAGSDIADAARDLCDLAEQTGVLCECDFNGVSVWARPGDDPVSLAAAYDEQIKLPAGRYKIAQADRKRLNVRVEPHA